MLSFILNFLAILPNTYLSHYFIGNAVPMKKPRLYALIVSILCQGIVWTVNNYLLPTKLVTLDLAVYLIAWVGLMFFTAPKYWFWGILTHIFITVTQYICSFTMIVVARPIVSAMGMVFEDFLNMDSYGYAVFSFICTCITCPAMYFCARLMHRLCRPVSISPWLLLFAAVPLSQIVLMNLCIRLAYFPGLYRDAFTYVVFSFALCLAADVAMFFGIIKYRQAQLLKSHMQLVQEQLDAQDAYYRQLQDNILHINQIRHDLNNQLQAAYQLLESGETSQARGQLDALQESVRNKVGARYCANLMVDAVVTDKARLCKKQGIRLDVNLELPAQLPMENAHLCSIFANLLDNGIHGVLESGTEEPHITLRAAVRAGHLSIHCSNPAVQTRKKASRDPLRKHGLGLEILDRLAKQYRGSLQTSFENGIFETTMICQLREE